MGGVIVLQLAAAHPGSVAAIVMVAVTDRDDFTEAHLLDDVGNIVGIGRDRVWSRRLVALAVPAKV